MIYRMSTSNSHLYHSCLKGSRAQLQQDELWLIALSVPTHSNRRTVVYLNAEIITQALNAFRYFNGGSAPCTNDAREKRVKRSAVGAIFDGDVVMRLVGHRVNECEWLIEAHLLTCSSSRYCFTLLMISSTCGDGGMACSCRS